jgi:hypothetical protein
LWCEEKLRCGENWAASVWVPPKFGGFPPLSKLCPKRARCAIGASCPHMGYKLDASQLIRTYAKKRISVISRALKECSLLSALTRFVHVPLKSPSERASRACPLMGHSVPLWGEILPPGIIPVAKFRAHGASRAHKARQERRNRREESSETTLPGLIIVTPICCDRPAFCACLKQFFPQ